MADAKYKWYFFAASWPKLLQKLSLDDGMKCFLEWKDQYEGWRSHYGINVPWSVEARYHAFYLLDHQLLDVLMDHMEEENFRDMDHETFVQELLDIFGEDPDLGELINYALTDILVVTRYSKTNTLSLIWHFQKKTGNFFIPMVL